MEFIVIEVKVVRNGGHPWDGRPGFDIMVIEAQSRAELDRAVATAHRKFWSTWIVGECEGTKMPGGVFYKPCGIAEAWEDRLEQPHPGCIPEASELDSPLNPN